jgi:hypothetical protein
MVTYYLIVSQVASPAALLHQCLSAHTPAVQASPRHVVLPT